MNKSSFEKHFNVAFSVFFFFSLQDEIASEEDHVEVEKATGVSKTRKTGKRTAK